MLTAESQDKWQRLKLIGAVVVFIIAVGIILRFAVGGKSAESLSAERVCKCVDCGHEFEHVLQMGEKEPLTCPKCGKARVWRAEACYWAKDGAGGWKAKTTPTFVVLKSSIDPSSREKTYCPDCGHLVTGHNRKPSKEQMEAAAKAGQ
ncbi:MAG TPA: zinc ribbon domain-containing protein [Phycisphaerae bacterium]|nr:zinc ribbon domain-containing protein [Phycisphaerae bacterium]